MYDQITKQTSRNVPITQKCWWEAYRCGCGAHWWGGVAVFPLPRSGRHGHSAFAHCVVHGGRRGPEVEKHRSTTVADCSSTCKWFWGMDGGWLPWDRCGRRRRTAAESRTEKIISFIEREYQFIITNSQSQLIKGEIFVIFFYQYETLGHFSPAQPKVLIGPSGSRNLAQIGTYFLWV